MKILLTILLIQGTILATKLSEIEIDNIKIPIIYEKSKYLPIVNFQLIFRNSGSISAKAGLANMVADILEEGTKTISNLKFAEKLDSKAISLSCGVGKETFAIQVSSLEENFDFGYDMLIQLIKNPNFKDQPFQKIKSSIIGQLSTKKSDFDFQANKNLKKIIFLNNALANSTIGNEQSIASIKLKDLEDFYNGHITLDNLIIVSSGSIPLDKIKNMLPRLLKELNRGKSKKINFKKIDKKNTVREFRPTNQAYIYFASPLDMKIDDKDVYISKVASYILGSSGFGSRLMEEIRVKRGLAYSVYSKFSILSLRYFTII